MASIPVFEPDGLLPSGDYEVSFEELRESILVHGPGDFAHTVAYGQLISPEIGRTRANLRTKESSA